ncbi:hypothetical protein POM88_001067 [Heracleum sosnowskyi]|uniref:Aminotransferase-like plant mobile domain-containing protein n=1 Tax=Heracleum sosnowskyi TaxID=360622 RepID=A0AAD8NA02_9APIA|nr:hypothetical protein POM88_001067 [Heracleum sosnowskyi]
MLGVVISTVSDDAHSDFELQPGPRDPSVLHLQAEHRSTHVLNSGGDTQRSRVRTKFPALHRRMVPILRDLRFDGVARLAVTGHTRCEGGWSNVVKNMFGEAPNLKGGRLKLNWLDSVVPKVLPDDANEDELLRYTRAYILQLLGGVLFTDHQGCQVHCMFIPLLENLSVCQELAWGAGVLAYLYRELCKSSKIGKEEITGCLLLLQLWAWTRLPTLAPISSGPSLDSQDIWGDLAGPYGLRWCGRKSFVDVVTHVVCVYRLSLDVLAPSHFIWMPYSDDVLDTLNVYCREGSEFWCYKGLLICFFIVEQHQPDRCVRQFGKIQDIPSPAAIYSKDLHNMTLQGKVDVDWGKTYRAYIILGQPVAIHVLEHISSIARGEVIGGGNRLIDSLATQSRHVLEYQFSRGLCQDFSVDDRRAKEDALKEKAKTAILVGGSKRRKMNYQNEGCEHVEEQRVHLGDEWDYVVDPGVTNVVDESGHRDTTNVQPSPSCYVPSFRLLASNDFLTPDEQPPVEESIDEQPELPPQHQHCDSTIIQLSQSAYIPTFRLLASNDFLTPPPIGQHDQQHQPSGEPGQQPPVEEVIKEQPLVEGMIEEQPVVERLEAPLEEQQEAAHEAHPMRLRTRNHHPPRGGTDGIKNVPAITRRYQR